MRYLAFSSEVSMTIPLIKKKIEQDIVLLFFSKDTYFFIKPAVHLFIAFPINE
jgi:hypothetical protein